MSKKNKGKAKEKAQRKRSERAARVSEIEEHLKKVNLTSDKKTVEQNEIVIRDFNRRQKQLKFKKKNENRR